MTTPRILVDKETGEEFEVKESCCSEGVLGQWNPLYYVQPIPKPEKSLSQEVIEEHGTISDAMYVLCRVLDRRLKELKK